MDLESTLRFASPRESIPSSTRNSDARDKENEPISGNKIRPLHDRGIVKRLPEEDVTKGGIIIPDSAKEKPIQGEVVAVGPGKTLDNGKTVAPDVKVGNKVLFGKYAGSEVKLDGAEHLILREDEILAVLE